MLAGVAPYRAGRHSRKVAVARSPQGQRLVDLAGKALRAVWGCASVVVDKNGDVYRQTEKRQYEVVGMPASTSP
jgi:hypothetical protein